MKQKVLYTCEVCHTDYTDKAKAMACEKHHNQKLTIIDARYLPLSQDDSGMPVTITVECGKGKKVIYKR